MAKTMKDKGNHSSDDHSAADDEDKAPALISSPRKEHDPSLSIRRSTYTSDIEDNDTSNSGGSPTIYKGSATHGILHVIDSTSKHPAMQIWLGDLQQLWSLAVNHYLRSTSYDTFTFTPFSTKENWDKRNPEMRITATAAMRPASPDKSASNNNKRSANQTKKSHVVRNNDMLSIIIQVCLCACVVYVYALLILFIRYLYAHDGDNLRTRMEVGGLERIGILFGEFMDGHHVSGLSHVGGMIYAVVSGQSRASNSGQQADATCDVTENSNDEILKTLEEDQKEADRNIAYDGSDLIDWIKSNGGFIHPNTRIGLDPTGQYRGVFVKSVGGEDGGTPDGIEKDAIICEIPWDVIASPPNYHYNDYGTTCDALHGFYHQFQLGDESKYAPYINYLKNQPDGRIPSEWSVVGKKLMRKILHQDRYVGLPPFNALYRFEEKWMKECNGEDTPLARSAFFQFTARDEDNLMVPFFDMHNHSNDPKKLNAIPAKPKKKGKPFTMRAIRDIAPGEQIIISYNRCHGCWFDEEYKNCDTRASTGTDHLFRQFGFVEDYPQCWHIPQIEEDGRHVDDMTISLDRNDQGEVFVRRFGENNSREEDEVPNMENLMWLDEHLQRLHKLKDSLQSDGALKKSMPSYEWDTAWTYHDAMVNAISATFKKVTGDAPYDNSKDNDTEDDSEDKEFEMAFIEDVVAPVEDDSSDDSEDESSDD